MALIAIALSGCAATPAHLPLDKPPVERTASDAETLLQYPAYLRRLTPTELAREFEALNFGSVRNLSELQRAQLAMIYALPGLYLHDDTKAMQLLDLLVREAQSPAVRGFALLVAGLVAERRRLDDMNQTLAAKLKAEQRANDQLEQKLEALKSIEKSLSDRDARPAERKSR